MTSMKVRLGLLLLGAFGLALCAAQAGTVQRVLNDKNVFVGEIMDSFCAKNGSHEELMEQMKSMGRDSRTCTMKCMEMGAKLVLLDVTHKTVYRLDDDGTKAFSYVGKKVRVTGTLHKNQLTIDTIEPIQ
jgi:hypothetical protein